jgi:hypothetical protein
LSPRMCALLRTCLGHCNRRPDMRILGIKMSPNSFLCCLDKSVTFSLRSRKKVDLSEQSREELGSTILRRPKIIFLY